MSFPPLLFLQLRALTDATFVPPLSDADVPVLFHYPVISTRDPMPPSFGHSGEVFFVKYLLKPQVNSRGSNVAFIIEPETSPNDNFRVCRLTVSKDLKIFPLFAFQTRFSIKS